MEYSLREEIANAISHGIGVLLSIAALVVLIVFSAKYGDAWHVVSFTIFGVSLLMLYTNSTLLHSITNLKAKNVFEILDHVSIYVLIAGTYTPFLLVTLRGPLGWTLFGIVWGLALLGGIMKSLFVKKFIFLSTMLYIGLGWIIIFAIGPLIDRLAPHGIAWLVAGGITYTLGTIFFLWRKIPYHHMIWHFFVIAGSVCHFICVLFYVLPMPQVAS